MSEALSLNKQRSSDSRAKSANDETFWRAVLTRDARFDGKVFFAVRSTGIYCRPSCPARRPVTRGKK